MVSHQYCFLFKIYVFVFSSLNLTDAGSNRKLLQRMLQQKGISSDGAENGQIAVDMAGTMPYDLIFMDFSMPVMVN